MTCFFAFIQLVVWDRKKPCATPWGAVSDPGVTWDLVRWYIIIEISFFGSVAVYTHIWDVPFLKGQCKGITLVAYEIFNILKSDVLSWNFRSNNNRKVWFYVSLSQLSSTKIGKQTCILYDSHCLQIICHPPKLQFLWDAFWNMYSWMLDNY